MMSIGLILSLVLTTWVTYRTTKHEMQEIMDGQLITTAKALFSLLAMEVREGHAEELPELLESFSELRTGYKEWRNDGKDMDVYASDFAVQVIAPGGEVAFHSYLLVPPIVTLGNIRTGFFEVSNNDADWIVFGLKDPVTEYYFFMAQSKAVRAHLSKEASVKVIFPELLSIPLILGGCFIFINIGLKPLRQLSKEVDTRSPDDYRPLPLQPTAKELDKLIVAINGLFQRMKLLIKIERQFSADASHELRTPLAGILSNVDAARNCDSDQQRLLALNNIEESARRSGRLADGLLLLSRLESPSAITEYQTNRFSVREVLIDEVSNLYSSYPAADFSVQLEKFEPLELVGPRSLFAIMIGNLLSNAVLHNNGHCEIVIDIKLDTAVEIHIIDNGKGLPEESQTRVFEKFYRVDSSAATGSGLGLSIVRRIAEVFGATVLLQNNQHQTGLSAIVSLPRFEPIG